MTKSEINPMPKFFDRYINVVQEENLFEAFAKSVADIENIDREKLKALGDKIYQQGKWTVKTIFQHLIDNERIQAYRALRFARSDKTTLPGYDENFLADHAFAQNRELDEILDEFIAVKHSNLLLFKGFDACVLQNSGMCFEIEISVLAQGFQMVGHQQHHFKVLKERYFPLLN